METLKDAIVRSGSASKKINIGSYNVNVDLSFSVTKNEAAEESFDEENDYEMEDSGTVRGKNDYLLTIIDNYDEEEKSETEEVKDEDS